MKARIVTVINSRTRGLAPMMMGDLSDEDSNHHASSDESVWRFYATLRFLRSSMMIPRLYEMTQKTWVTANPTTTRARHMTEKGSAKAVFREARIRHRAEFETDIFDPQQATSEMVIKGDGKRVLVCDYGERSFFCGNLGRVSCAMSRKKAADRDESQSAVGCECRHSTAQYVVFLSCMLCQCSLSSVVVARCHPQSVW